MTYHDYIQNPMGIKNAVISNREMYRKMYTEKWDAIKLRENGIIKYILFKSKTDYYAYIKVPSEVIPNFYYDVVIRFFPENKTVVVENTLENYDVQFFSNDPSYVFTFAHAFSKNNLFIEDLSKRMSKLALKKTASEKNPNDQVGYVKSLYFAYLFIKSKGLMTKDIYSTGINYDKNYLLSLIEDADIKIDDRQKATEKLKKEKKSHNTQKRKTPTTTDHSAEKKPFGNNGVLKPISSISSKSKISGKSKITGSSHSRMGKR